MYTHIHILYIFACMSICMYVDVHTNKEVSDMHHKFP